jgi:hypothetical protein
MKNTWIKVGIVIDSTNLHFNQVINISDMINTDYTRLLDDSIVDNYKKALKACNGKFDMITISISRSVSYSYTYQCLKQYRFLGKKSTPNNPDGIEGSRYFDNMFGDFQPCDKKDIVAKIKAYVAKANSLYVEAIKENSQQLIAG